MTVVQFPTPRADVDHAVALGKTRFPAWVFESVIAEDGTKSIAATHRSIETGDIQLDGTGWVCLDQEGQAVARRQSLEAAGAAMTEAIG